MALVPAACFVVPAAICGVLGASQSSEPGARGLIGAALLGLSTVAFAASVLAMVACPVGACVFVLNSKQGKKDTRVLYGLALLFVGWGVNAGVVGCAGIVFMVLRYSLFGI